MVKTDLGEVAFDNKSSAEIKFKFKLALDVLKHPCLLLPPLFQD